MGAALGAQGFSTLPGAPWGQACQGPGRERWAGPGPAAGVKPGAVRADVVEGPEGELLEGDICAVT